MSFFNINIVFFLLVLIVYYKHDIKYLYINNSCILSIIYQINDVTDFVLFSLVIITLYTDIYIINTYLSIVIPLVTMIWFIINNLFYLFISFGKDSKMFPKVLFQNCVDLLSKKQRFLLNFGNFYKMG